MIEFVHLENFKCLRDVRFEGLQPLTVVVGPSGVGKTSLLQALWWISQTEVKPRAKGFFPIEGKQYPELGRLVTIGTTRLAIRCHGDALTMDLFVTADGGASSENRSGPVPRAELLEFDTRRLTAPSVMAERHPHLQPDGTGLPTLLNYFAGAERDTLAAIEADLREILAITGRIRTVPDAIEVEEREDIRIDGQLLPRVTRRTTIAYRFELEIDGQGSVPGDLLSEGTLVTLGLLTVLHQTTGPQLILFDDIDKGLHPDAQAKLIASLRKLIARRADLQIICTSHSPYLLDQFEPTEVQVMSLHAGQVSVARLDKHPEWPRWQGKLQTGEFWQSVGESWVTAKHEDAADGS